MVYKFDFFASVRSGAVHLVIVWQSNCLICLPDKSGNFHTFGAKTSDNSINFRKTGFGMAIIARPRPVFCVFEPKIPRTFWGKCTEQSSRKKLTVGGFEPEKVRLLYPAPLKKPLLSTTTREVFPAFWGKNGSKYRKNSGWSSHQGRSGHCFCIFGVKNAGYFLDFFAKQRVWQNDERQDLKHQKR